MTAAASPWLAKTKWTSGLASCPCCSAGISRRHGGHHDAHKLTTAGLPRNSLMGTGCPSSVVIITSLITGLGELNKLRAAYVMPNTLKLTVAAMRTGLRDMGLRHVNHAVETNAAIIAAVSEKPPSRRSSILRGRCIYVSKYAATKVNRLAHTTISAVFQTTDSSS